jgi:uncharacterized protein (TIGR03083 family)
LSLTALGPTATVHLFPTLSAELLALLRALPADDWYRPTACTGWSVKDVVAHLLGGNIGRLSFGRDRLQRESTGGVPTTNATLVAMINDQNATWVSAARQISPPVLLDFLALTDRQVAAYFAALPMDEATAIGVGWAGETRSAHWFDIGREYTEKWFHQQHIREAVGASGLVERRWLRPVIEICLHALPFTYRSVEAADGTAVVVRIAGDAGGVWSLVRNAGAWQIYAGEDQVAAAVVHFSDDTAWRLFSKGLDRETLAQRITSEGDRALGSHIVDALAIMA